MKITKEWLKEERACSDGYKWSIDTLKNKPMEDKLFVKKLVKCEHYDWANWIFERIFSKKQSVQYSIFAAEQVIFNFEKKYPNDDRPRKAIEAAKLVLEKDTEKNRSAASAAASAAWSAARSAASAESARSAAWSARSAASAASAASAESAESAESEMQKKIISHGITILE